MTRPLLLLLYVVTVIGTGDRTPRRRPIQKDDPSTNYGNSVLLGPLPPSEPHTRINSKVMTDPSASKETQKIKTYTSSVSGESASQKDIADILTNLQILNILTTEDAHAIATHYRDSLLQMPPQQDPGTSHKDAVYHMTAAQHYLDPDPPPEPAGPPPASPLSLPTPLNQEATGSPIITTTTSSDPARYPPSPPLSVFTPALFDSNSAPSPAYSPSGPAHSIIDSLNSVPGSASPTSPSQGNEGFSNTLAPPAGVDLTHIVNQLTQEDMEVTVKPSHSQLSTLNEYLQDIKHQHLGGTPTEEMLLASLLHQHNNQHYQDYYTPYPLHPTHNNPYVPALHGPYSDPKPPAPPSPPALPPAPPESSETDDVALLPQSDFLSSSSGGGGGLRACIEGGGCALLLAILISTGMTLALATPVVASAFGIFGRRRRRAVLGEDSTMLEYLKHHHATLLATSIAKVEEQIARPLDPTLLQTLKEGDPDHLLPLLRQTLRIPAPHSLRLVRQICKAVVSSNRPFAETTVITAQQCLLLAAARCL